MLLHSFIIGISFLISFASIYFIRKIAIKKSIMDFPGERSIHTRATPRGGGLAIVFSWYLYLIYCYFFGFMDVKLLLAMFPGIIIVIVSLFDDLKGLSPYFRILAHLLASALGLLLLGGLNLIDFGMFQLSIKGITNILVLIGMVWCINIFNFLDGIDGYLGSEGVFLFLALALFARDFSCLVFAFCIVGFLLWNWPMAKIFCGDVGSTLIGYTLAIFAIYYQNTNRISLIIPIILSGLFWLDATVTLTRRLLNGENPRQRHLKHASQRLIKAGFTHSHVLLIGWAINSFLFVFALIGFFNSPLLPYLLLMQILLVFLFIRFANRRKSFEKIRT
jgi:UDP-N-acetylmuramyl pentapeptide phosphotransferase/UDP-N-acetylglucosamine-1-phosphate transferase